MNEKSLIDIGKLLLIAVAFIAPMIFKYLKKQSENRAKNNKFAQKPDTHFRPKIKNISKKEVSFNEIMSDLFSEPEAKPARIQPQTKRQKQPFGGSDFKNIDAEKIMPEMLSEKKRFQRIDLKKNTSPVVNNEIVESMHLTKNMTNLDWKKAIIMKEILEEPIALR